MRGKILSCGHTSLTAGCRAVLPQGAQSLDDAFETCPRIDASTSPAHRRRHIAGSRRPTRCQARPQQAPSQQAERCACMTGYWIPSGCDSSACAAGLSANAAWRPVVPHFPCLAACSTACRPSQCPGTSEVSALQTTKSRRVPLRAAAVQRRAEAAAPVAQTAAQPCPASLPQ